MYCQYLLFVLSFLIAFVDKSNAIKRRSWYPPSFSGNPIYFPSNIGHPSIQNRGPSAPNLNNPSAKAPNGEHSIVFPEAAGRKISKPDPQKTKKCYQDLCEEFPDYPEEIITRLLQKKDYAELFANITPPAVEVNVRFNNEDRTELCNAKTRTMKPQTARNVKDEVKYLINTKEYQQLVIVEVCEDQNHKCNDLVQFPQGYTSQCVQKFQIKRLTSIENNAPAIDYFNLPSCCVCTFEKITTISRIGAAKKKQKRRNVRTLSLL